MFRLNVSVFALICKERRQPQRVYKNKNKSLQAYKTEPQKIFVNVIIFSATYHIAKDVGQSVGWLFTSLWANEQIKFFYFGTRSAPERKMNKWK